MPKPTVPSGELRHRVTLRTRVKSRGSTGSGTTSNSDSAGTYWARVIPSDGREYERSGLAAASEVTHVVTMRRIPAAAALTSDDAIVFKQRVLEIVAIENAGEENVLLNFVCRETR